MTLAALSSQENDPGWQRLVAWQCDGARLAFVYSRSLGGLMQTGQCRIARLTPDAATLETAGSKLMVALTGTTYETGPQLFFTPDLLSHYGVDGVALRLPNHDWLFFSEQAIPAHLQLNSRP
ncbi:MAG: hypothetical protein V4631_07240 [Pseudomonadota bacterium]